MNERMPYPTETEVAHARMEQHDLEQYTGCPGRVERYDAATQTADIVPLVRHPVPQPDGSYTTEDLPVVPSVPVLMLRSGRMFFAPPLAPGDTVQLLVNTSAIGHWRAGAGDVTDPGDLRRQHLSHAVAIPGLYVRRKALAHASATDLVMGDDEGTRLAIKPDGTVTVRVQLDAGGRCTAARVALSGLAAGIVGVIVAGFPVAVWVRSKVTPVSRAARPLPIWLDSSADRSGVSPRRA